MHEVSKVVKKMLEEWIKEDENVDIVDKYSKRMVILENWGHGARATGRHERCNKTGDLFIKITNSYFCASAREAKKYTVA